ncbi:hypothetical protein MMC11_005514 [Xylographa trunciseda]|nr:hypothetical protein [Xylographa trunciseda]
MPVKSVLITGASAGGIGSALALAFQKRGFHVFATARSPSKLAHFDHNPDITTLTLDVTSKTSIAKAFEEVREKLATIKSTGLDVLVNNSGRGYVTPMLDADMEEARALFDVNFWGVIAVTQVFAPLLIGAKGTVVNISSISKGFNDPYRGMYGASKAAITIAGETMRLEMAPFGVKVVTVVAGVITSHFSANMPDFKLPSNSVYLPIKTEIDKVANGTDLPSAMDVDVFAKKLVGDVLGGANGLVYRGRLATLSWFLLKFLPVWALDSLLLKDRGLDKLASIVKAR